MKQFRTVEEIWEKYFPPKHDAGAEAGRRIAKKLLVGFRQSLRYKPAKDKEAE